MQSQGNKIMKRCPKCNNGSFETTQRCRLDIIVDGENNFLDNKPGLDKGGITIIDAEDPYGPYYCTHCGKEFDSLDELIDPDATELPESQEPVDWQAKYSEKDDMFKLAMRLLISMTERCTIIEKNSILSDSDRIILAELIKQHQKS